LKIILDARKIGDYGIGNYLYHIFNGLIQSGQFDHKVVYLGDTNPLGVGDHCIIRSQFANYRWQEHFEIPRKVQPYRDYYYFSPHYVFPVFLKNPLIVAIHDLIHFKFSHFFKPAIKVSLAKYFIKKARKKATMVLTGSHSAKQDLCEMFGFREDRIEVIYHGVADAFFEQARSPSSQPYPYIAYMGNFKPHKNLSLLLEAFAKIKQIFPELRLVLMGIREGQALDQLIKFYDLASQIIVKGFLPLEELIAWVDGSEFFVFPSLYEGFGLPPLEAMARNKAVISSTGGSLPEILEENALFFDPRSSDDLADKMSLFLKDTTICNTYARKGYRHAQGFRWNKAVDQYIRLLTKLA
jgi:glycosyltransferase involved in cell wall biosynthesis